MKQKLTIFIGLSLYAILLSAQSSALKLEDYLFQVDNLEDSNFKSFTKELLKNSQFVFIGEQHGIKEVGQFTNAIFNIAQDYDYHTLCIETDAIAAKKITEIAEQENSIEQARAFDSKFPFAIPFYNNEDDYELFSNVVGKGGKIWGIDQTFMAQFRMNFDYLINTTSNNKLKNRLTILKNESETAYNNALKNKNFNAMYIFKYDDVVHNELLNIAATNDEKEVLNQLFKTKEIYAYNNISKEYYKNNNVRGQLMKDNFINYYKTTQKEEQQPKVIFKLGANHAAKGLTRTNIYDIANFGSELAIFNNKKTLHYIVFGISGKVTTGNPFAPNPVVDFNSKAQFPKEIQDLLPTMVKKYNVLHLEPFREKAYGKQYSEAFKTLIFAYDVMVLVNDAKALKSF